MRHSSYIPSAGSTLLYLLHYLALLGVSLQFCFGEDQVTVNRYLKAPSRSSDKGDAIQLLPELIDQFFRQPGGSRAIASFLAIENLYFHFGPPC
jgi:hypothetical protein